MGTTEKGRRTSKELGTKSEVEREQEKEIERERSKHARICKNGTIDWDNPTILTTYNNKNECGLQQNLLIRESLEICRLKTSRGQGLNDPQLCVRSNAWDPILTEI